MYSTVIIIATSSSAPSSVSHSVLNATAVTISWDITGNVNGFVINITSSVSDTVTKQLTDSSVREFVVNGLIPEVEYTVAVRGYYELLGPADTTTVRLEGIILMCNFIKGQWVCDRFRQIDPQCVAVVL